MYFQDANHPLTSPQHTPWFFGQQPRPARPSVPQPPTPHQQRLAKVIASGLPVWLRPEVEAALLAGPPAQSSLASFDVWDMEHALALDALPRYRLDDLCGFLATEAALARQFITVWRAEPLRAQRLAHNRLLGEHAARMRRLLLAFLAHPQEQPLRRFRQVMRGPVAPMSMLA